MVITTLPCTWIQARAITAVVIAVVITDIMGEAAGLEAMGEEAIMEGVVVMVGEVEEEEMGEEGAADVNLRREC